LKVDVVRQLSDGAVSLMEPKSLVGAANHAGKREILMEGEE
jgi:hypothetical protein